MQSQLSRRRENQGTKSPPARGFEFAGVQLLRYYTVEDRESIRQSLAGSLANRYEQEYCATGNVLTVSATPITSRPEIANGIAAACIGVGETKRLAWRNCRSDGWSSMLDHSGSWTISTNFLRMLKLVRFLETAYYLLEYLVPPLTLARVSAPPLMA